MKGLIPSQIPFWANRDVPHRSLQTPSSRTLSSLQELQSRKEGPLQVSHSGKQGLHSLFEFT